MFRGLQPWLVPYAEALYRWAVYYGFRPTVTSVYRSRQKQAVLYDRWRRGLSDIPAAPPGRSKHEHGLAFDMVATQGYKSEAQTRIGSAWASMGGRWFPSDPVHFEV